MISPYKIKWLGETSLEYDTHTGISFDGDNGEIDTHLGREAVVSEAYNGTFKRAHSYKWNNDFILTVTLVKTDYSDFSQEENRKILKWLTSSKNAAFLDVYHDDSEVVSYSVLGNWTNVSQYKLGNGRIVGYVAEFESLTPWAFSDLESINKDVSNPADAMIIVDLETDEPQSPVYPRITIKQNNVTAVVEVDHAMTDQDEWLDGTVYHYNGSYYWIDATGVKHTSGTNDSGFDTTSVSITNVNTQEFTNGVKKATTNVINNIKGETVVLDGANRVVSSSRINGRIFGDDFSWEWLPLFDGHNELTITGNCTVTIEYRVPIKAGEF